MTLLAAKLAVWGVTRLKLGKGALSREWGATALNEVSAGDPSSASPSVASNFLEGVFFFFEAVPGPSVFPSGEPGVSGDFWGSQEGSPKSKPCLFERLWRPHYIGMTD